MSFSLLLKCRDTNETSRFYKDVLGFGVAESANRTMTVWKEDARIVFTEANLWPGEPRLTGTIYFTMDEVDAFFTAIGGRVEVAWPIQSMAYGSREFGIVDCNGYILAFQQRAE